MIEDVARRLKELSNQWEGHYIDWEYDGLDDPSECDLAYANGRVDSLQHCVAELRALVANYGY